MINKPPLGIVDSMDLSEQNERLVHKADIFFRGPAGREHYKLLAWLSHQFNGVIFAEFGTMVGYSALALGHNKNNKVITHDLRTYDGLVEFPHNITQKLIPRGIPDFNELKEVPLIFYDTSHNGDDERFFIKGLMDINWKGILVLDDIYYNEPMKQLWAYLQETANTEDWSDIGHFSGTGIVRFD